MHRGGGGENTVTWQTVVGEPIATSDLGGQYKGVTLRCTALTHTVITEDWGRGVLSMPYQCGRQ